MRSGSTATSSARPWLVTVKPQAIAGATAATCSAAAEATLDSPVLQEMFTRMPSRSQRRQASSTARKPPSFIAFRLTPLGGLGYVMALDVVARMDALVGADRHAARRGHLRHGVKRMGFDRLLEKIEPAIGHRPHEALRVVDGKTLIGVGRDEASFPPVA